jgi:hypothetical protein
MPGRGPGQGQGQNQPPQGNGFPGAGAETRTAPGAGIGGLLNGADVDSAARKLLETDADDYTWAAAAVGAQNAAGYQLATGDPVMAIGGFNGTDPSPTLAQFKEYVADGKIHYFIAGGGNGGGNAGENGGGGMGGSDTAASAQITSWVEANFTEVTAGSATFYDLTRPTDD